MRLCDAIRAGAKLRPQSFGGSAFKGDGSCALAAAYEAVSGETETCSQIVLFSVHRQFLILKVSPDLIPELVQLNDKDKWSRERIADYVEERERQMTRHLSEGQFKSDKYAWSPPGFLPLKLTDPMAQDLLFEYAQRRREIDRQFADDLQMALKLQGFTPGNSGPEGGS